MSIAFDPIAAAFSGGFESEPILTVSQWADQHRMVSPKYSPEPGRWRTSRVPYLREIMDSLSVLNPASRVVFMKGAQIGATEAGQNWLGYIIDASPGPTLMVYPTLDDAKKVSKTRVAPTIEETPRLAALVKSPRSRDSGNTLLVKEFKGGTFIMTGANSGAGLRQMPIRFLFCDEVDEYPPDVDGQGDPIALATARTKNFRSKIYLVSTPTTKGHSRIETEFKLTDQRFYFVPCPHCGYFDWIRWENIRWEKNQPETAHLVCIACTQKIEEARHKTVMLERGRWTATAEAAPGLVGFHLSGLYSPVGWYSWAEAATDWLAAQKDPPKLVTFINTVLGETYEERGSATPDELEARLETYAGEVPNGVGALVMSVDTQDDRLEYHVVGFGAAEESWLIRHEMIMGDPSQLRRVDPEVPTVWEELDRVRRQTFTHENGRQMRIARTMVDSGGSCTDEVYTYCKARRSAKVYAIRGGNMVKEPLIGLPSYNNRLRIPVYTLCTDTGKATIAARLKIGEKGPGFMHMPQGLNREYIEQLVSEIVVWKWQPRGGHVRAWKKIRDRNEAFDLTVYSLAALRNMGDDFIRRLPEEAARWARPLDAPARVRPTEAPADAAAPDVTEFPDLAPAQGLEASPDPTPLAPARPKRPARKGWVDRY